MLKILSHKIYDHDSIRIYLANIINHTNSQGLITITITSLKSYEDPAHFFKMIQTQSQLNGYLKQTKTRLGLQAKIRYWIHCTNKVLKIKTTLLFMKADLSPKVNAAMMSFIFKHVSYVQPCLSAMFHTYMRSSVFLSMSSSV